MIYNYLLHKAYKLARLAKNEYDDAIWWAAMIVGSCLIFNIATIIFLLDGIGLITYSGFDNKYRYIGGSLMALIVGGYYSYQGKYRKILKYYESKEENKKNIHPLIVVLSYCVLSVILLVLSAMFKHGNYLFK